MSHSDKENAQAVIGCFAVILMVASVILVCLGIVLVGNYTYTTITK